MEEVSIVAVYLCAIAYPIEEATSLLQHPSPFCQLNLSLFQRLVAFIQRTDPLFQYLTPVGQFINLIRPWCSEQVLLKVVATPHFNLRLLHLRLKVDQL